MTGSEEHYFHFSCCIDWLNECRSLLQRLKDDRDNPLREPAFRFALVLYAKPYRESRGNAVKKHRLDHSFVPPKFFALHKELMAERDQVHAHSDLTVLDARLSIHSYGTTRYALTVQNTLDQTKMIHKIDEIISLVENTLDKLIAEVKLLEANL